MDEVKGKMMEKFIKIKNLDKTGLWTFINTEPNQSTDQTTEKENRPQPSLD